MGYTFGVIMNSFFAMISRMKYINRWGLMRNTREENICEHSLETAVIAHALAMIRNTRFNGDADPGRVALLAMYHDAAEIITGDMPTPVKYHSPKIRDAYKEVEVLAVEKLSSMLPRELEGHYKELLLFSGPRDMEYAPIIKAADKLSALVKCIEEIKTGNMEFVKAEQALRRAVEAMDLPEARVYMEEILPSYALSVDD